MKHQSGSSQRRWIAIATLLGLLLAACSNRSPVAELDEAAAAPVAIPPALSDAQLEVRRGLVLAGELDLDVLAAAEVAGLVIIDLRDDETAVESERAAADALGVEHLNVPVHGAVIDEAALVVIADLLEANAHRSVVMHCGTGNRAAMIWAALQLDQGQSTDAVLASLAPLVTREPVEAAIRAYGGEVVEDHEVVEGAGGAQGGEGSEGVDTDR